MIMLFDEKLLQQMLCNYWVLKYKLAEIQFINTCAIIRLELLLQLKRTKEWRWGTVGKMHWILKSIVKLGKSKMQLLLEKSAVATLSHLQNRQ